MRDRRQSKRRLKEDEIYMFIIKYAQLKGKRKGEEKGSGTSGRRGKWSHCFRRSPVLFIASLTMKTLTYSAFIHDVFKISSQQSDYD